MERKVGMAVTTALIKAKQPPRNRMQVFHLSSRRSTFSITSCQSYFETRPADSGIPRYLIGRDLHIDAKIVEQRVASSSSILKVTSMDLSQLRQRPEKSEMSSISDVFSAASVAPSSKNILSSAYWRSGIPCCSLIVCKPYKSLP